jgi:hypothetical protein
MDAHRAEQIARAAQAELPPPPEPLSLPPPLPPVAPDPIRAAGAATDIFADEGTRIVHKWTNKDGVVFELHMSNPGYLNKAHADAQSLANEAKEKWMPTPLKTRENHAIQQAERARTQFTTWQKELFDIIELRCDQIRDARKRMWLWDARVSLYNWNRDAEKELERKKQEAIVKLGDLEGLDE